MLFIHDESATKQTALRRRNPKGGKGLPVAGKLDSPSCNVFPLFTCLTLFVRQTLSARLAGLSPRTARLDPFPMIFAQRLVMLACSPGLRIALRKGVSVTPKLPLADPGLAHRPAD